MQNYDLNLNMLKIIKEMLSDKYKIIYLLKNIHFADRRSIPNLFFLISPGPKAVYQGSSLDLTSQFKRKITNIIKCCHDQ